MKLRRLTAGIAVAAGLVLSALPMGSAAARSSTADDAVLRGAHLSPDTPSVDVYLTAFSGHTTTLWLTSVGYGDVSPYRQMKPGLYAISMRAHGAKASSPAALSWTARLRAGHAYTAAAIGMNRNLHGIVIGDELTPPASGTSRVRVIQAASRAPRAKVYAGQGTVLAAAVPFGATTPYTTVRAGQWQLHAASVESPSLAASAELAVPSGSVESLVVLDAKGRGITIRSLVDAAGARAVPNGAVPAGGGGTAVAPSASSRVPALLVALVLAAGAVIGAAMRRARRTVRTR